MTERQIKPEDIRVGDRIRIEWMAGGVFQTWTGTVAKVDADGDFESKEGRVIGTSYIKEIINDGENITITLLDRPKPPLPTEVGSVIHVSECRGIECDTLAMLDRDWHWCTPIPSRISRDRVLPKAEVNRNPPNAVAISSRSWRVATFALARACARSKAAACEKCTT